MPELSLSPEYIARLIVKLRAVQARVDVDEDDGSNPSDDEAVQSLRETPDDLEREELPEEVRGTGRQAQAELVALLWLGRGDAEVDDWDELVVRAEERQENATEEYLLEQPLVAEYLAEGLEKLGL